MYGVILTAGIADATLIPIFGQIPTGLVPVNGKPIIFFIIENFLKIDIKDIYIGVDHDSEYLKKIINTFFKRKANLHFIEVDKTKGPGDSLITIFHAIGSGPALVNLADTLVPIEINKLKQQNAVLISQEIDNPERWCLVDIDEHTAQIQAFHEKKADAEPKNGVVGLYSFRDVGILKNYSPTKDKTQISDLISFAMNTESFTAIEAGEWLDFGHIDKYQVGKKKMLSSRFFNTLEFDDLLGTVTKRSKDTKKFVEEIRWQMNLPPRVEVLFPRIIATDIHCRNPFITMEYYSYQSVSEIWLYSSFGTAGLLSIIQKILSILYIFTEYSIPVSRKSYFEVYVEKTNQRMHQLITENKLFEELLQLPEIQINGLTYYNWVGLRDSIFSKLDQLYSEEMNCLVHGDFCFSNILYDVSGGVIRLIDPRGSWGGSIGGDIRYDVAKLRHSICGLYDFIVNDLFIVNLSNESIEYEVFCQPHHRAVGERFDELIGSRFDLQQIKLIEGTLFLSMIPLHADNPSRQLMMFCRAIELLNAVVASDS